MEPLVYDDYLSSINLPRSFSEPKFADVIGWGISCPYNTEKIEYSRVLKETHLQLLPLSECQQYYIKHGVQVYHNQTCAIPYNNLGNVALVSILIN